jgi:uracil-DNA glycosylase family 4
VAALAPPRDCPLCPRLVAYRASLRHAHPDWHNAPVASFGPRDARLLIVGLAPGAQGANRTGRPFTGDHAGLVLYPALAAQGLSSGSFAARPDDGLELVDARITNAVRCVPPANKPTGREIATCRRFLHGELHDSPRPRVVLSLGRIAHDSVLRVLALSATSYPFAHGAVYHPPDRPALVASYHCSRYNMNTGRLTTGMFEAVMATVRRELAALPALAAPLAAAAPRGTRQAGS